MSILSYSASPGGSSSNAADRYIRAQGAATSNPATTQRGTLRSPADMYIGAQQTAEIGRLQSLKQNPTPTTPWSPTWFSDPFRAAIPAAPNIDFGALDRMNASTFLSGLDLMNQARSAYDRVAGNLAAQQVHYGNLGNFARRDYDLGMRGVGLDREMLDLNRSSATGDINDINAGFGVVRGKYDARLAGLLGDATQLQATERRLLGLDAEAIKELGYQEQRQQRQLMSQMGASGAIGAQGQIETGRDIAQGAKQARTDIGEAAAKRNDQLTKELRDIDTSKSILNWDLRQAELDRNTQLRKIEERQRTLDIEARKLNLTAEQLSLGLQKQLEQLNLQRTISQGQLLDALNSRDAAVKNAAFQVMNQIQLNTNNAPRRQP